MPFQKPVLICVFWNICKLGFKFQPFGFFFYLKMIFGGKMLSSQLQHCCYAVRNQFISILFARQQWFYFAVSQTQAGVHHQDIYSYHTVSLKAFPLCSIKFCWGILGSPVSCITLSTYSFWSVTHSFYHCTHFMLCTSTSGCKTLSFLPSPCLTLSADVCVAILRLRITHLGNEMSGCTSYIVFHAN